MRGLNTSGGFNHRRHDAAKRQLKELREQEELKARQNQLALLSKELRGGGFIVTFRTGEIVEVVFVWAESVAQARSLAWHHCSPKNWSEVVARPTGLTLASRKVGLVKFN